MFFWGDSFGGFLGFERMARVRRSSFTLAPCGEPVGEGQTTNGPGGDGGGGGQGDERNQPSPTGTQSPLQAQEEQLRSGFLSKLIDES